MGSLSIKQWLTDKQKFMQIKYSVDAIKQPQYASCTMFVHHYICELIWL